MTLGPYELNNVYCEDCLEAMRKLPDGCCVVITDPPYGVKRDKGFGGFEGFGGFGKPIARKRFEDDAWDNERPAREVFDRLLELAKTALIFGGNYFADMLPQGKHWIVWDKKQTMPTFGDAELIWTNVKRNSVTIIECEWNGLIGKEGLRHHPTQKPVKLMEEIIEKYTHPDDIIPDPFAGSGTTLVAAKQLGRKFLGFETEPKYVDICKQRLAQDVLDLR